MANNNNYSTHIGDNDIQIRLNTDQIARFYACDGYSEIDMNRSEIRAYDDEFQLIHITGSGTESIATYIGIGEEKITITGESPFKIGSEKSTVVSSIPAGNAGGVNVVIDKINGYTPVAIKSVRTSQMTSAMIGGWYFSRNSSGNPAVRIGYRNVTNATLSNVTFYATVLYAKNELL